jgi:hypothetical protein
MQPATAANGSQTATSTHSARMAAATEKPRKMQVRAAAIVMRVRRTRRVVRSLILAVLPGDRRGHATAKCALAVPRAHRPYTLSVAGA